MTTSPSKPRKPRVKKSAAASSEAPPKAEITPDGLYRINLTKQHTVYRNKDGKRIPGVTTALGVINKPQLLKWAYNCGVNGEDYTKIRDEAADIGTIGHAMVEAHLRGMTLDRSNLSADKVSKAENSFLKFLSWWDEEGFDLVCTEKIVVSEAWQCGGTIDIVARNRNGDLILVDLKTGKGIYDEHKAQTAAYASFYEEAEGEPISRIIICRIGREEAGDFEFQHVHNPEKHLEVFGCALNLYRARQRAGHR